MHRAAVRGFRHELSPEAGDRRGHLSHQIR